MARVCSWCGLPDQGWLRSLEGLGTATKPAFEPVIVARKPLGKGTVAANVLEHGTGALNIDGCRIETTERIPNHHGTNGAAGVTFGQRREYVPGSANAEATHDKGRWPANVVLDADQAAALDEQSGTLKSGANPTRRGSDKFRDAYGDFKGQEECMPARGADSGGASRFFYVAREDKKCGFEGDTSTSGESLGTAAQDGSASSVTVAASERLDSRFRYMAKAPKKERPVVIDTDGKTHSHPTVKPLALMCWLVRLVTPPGGVVLDPFAGSGTTVEAALLEGFRVVGVEREADYLPMIQQRIARVV